MDRRRLLVVGAIIVASVLIITGFGFAYDIYMSQENCEQMDDRRRITANCWAFPSRFLVAGGILIGLSGIGLLSGSTLWYRSRTGQGHS